MRNTCAALVIALFVATCVATNNAKTLIAKLTHDASPLDYAARHGLQYVGPLDFLGPEQNYHKFLLPSPPQGSSKRSELRDDPHVMFAEIQEPKLFSKRGIPDPLYIDQWHLHGHPFGIDADFLPAASVPAAEGRGVTIAIVDDGLQHEHPDLKRNYDASHSWDFNDMDSDPNPTSYDGHGTAAAGVAAAVKENGVCGRGVAPSASLVGIRLIAAGVTDEMQARALSHQAVAQVDIFSCSWGPEDNGILIDGPSQVTEATLATYTMGRRGRMGKGTIYVWAAGNGRTAGDSCAFDGYASSPYTIAVGALDYQGQQSWYSEGCAALFVVAPSSGAGKGITTTDLMGAAGYSAGECTDRFGGTSAAAPLAAGVIALLLERRPELTWRDVKHVLAKGSRVVNPQDESWSRRNRRGYQHSNKFGFGLLSVPLLMRALDKYQLVPADMKTCQLPIVTFDVGHGVMPFTFALNMSGCPITFIEHVMLTVALVHETRGRASVYLTSPEGVTSLLAPERPRDRTVDYPFLGWRFTTVHHWGEDRSNGVWQVNADSSAGAGVVTGLVLMIMGF